MSAAQTIEDMPAAAAPFAEHRLSFFDGEEIAYGNTYIGAVDLSKVAGTTHPDYAGKTWGELKPVPGSLRNELTDTVVLYQPLKRAPANLQALHKNPGYYESLDKKDYWSFYLLDGKYYVAEGNNRTVIGRFFFHVAGKPPIVHGVKITEASRKKQPVQDAPKKASWGARAASWFGWPW